MSNNFRQLYKFIKMRFIWQAIAFNAKDVSNRYGRSTKIREYFARTKAVLDIIINKQPKFLGEKIEIK